MHLQQAQHFFHFGVQMMDLTTPTAFAFLFFILITTTKAIDPCATLSEGPDLSIIPLYGKCSPFVQPKPESILNTVLDLASKDPERLKYLSSLSAQKTATSVPIASGQQVLNVNNYVVRAQLGSPAQLMYMVLDTSRDASWAPCAGCTGCSTTTFEPNTSSTYALMDCSMVQCTQVSGFSCPAIGASPCLFNQSYGGDSSFSASLVKDALTMGKDVIPDYIFGCINSISGGQIPPQGLMGLGRGPLSLLSQSGALYSGVFSYCLPSFRSYYFSGSLKLGPIGQPRSIKTTPLLKNPHRPSLYYVNLTGINVGKVKVPIASELLAFDPITGAGTIIDSGTVITRFVRPIYEAIRDEFRNQVTGPFSSLGSFDTCFSTTNEAVAPPITLHFAGLDLVLPLENSLLHSSSGSLACLSMAAAPNNINSVLNVIANLQQQNLRILFDEVNSRVGIARELCN